jgi:predicted MPP superfamily phosphohydrolase
LSAAAAALLCLGYWMWRALREPRSRLFRQACLAVSFAVGLLLAAGVLLRSARVAALLSNEAASWIRGGAMMTAFVLIPSTILALLAAWLHRPRPAGDSPADAGRRSFIREGAAAVVAVPALALGYGVFIERRRIGLREVDIPIDGLPAGLNGLKLVQITDIHLSPFLSPEELAYAVALANETKAHVALVTGDLISTRRDPLDACLDELSLLKADAGVFGCMGNHENYAGSVEYTWRRGAELGLRFLRKARARLQFSGGSVNLAGVDYQEAKRPYLEGAEQLVDPTADLNILLSHNPDVFPIAARKGFGLTIAGHTHGGQVTVEILRQHANVARFVTPYVDGLYRERNAAVYVSRGIGTIGLPARIGSAPEVSLLRLCAT